MKFIATAFLADRMGWRTYDPEATFSVSLAYEIETNFAVDAAEVLFARLNRDDRPNRFMQRSMCVGDAVRIDSERGVEWFGVDAVGFAKVGCPTKFSDGGDPGLSEHMATRPAILTAFPEYA